jgi:hypothetical protein
MSEHVRRILHNYCLFLVRGFEARILSPVERDGVMWLDWAARKIYISDRKGGDAPRFAFPMSRTQLSVCPSNAKALVVHATATEPRCVLLMVEAPTAQRIVAYWQQWVAAGQLLGAPSADETCDRNLQCQRRVSDRRVRSYERLLS